MEPFATLGELKNRLDWTLDADEERIAVGALEDASDLARAHSRQWPDAASAPRLVRTLVLASCKRYMQNPEGYTISRAGDEQVSSPDVGDKAGSPYFTDGEIKLLAGLAGRSVLTSVDVTSWGPMDKQAVGFVPVADRDEKPFPFFASNENDW